MKLAQHSYFQKGNRIPKPQINLNEKEKLVLFGFPWGNRDSSEQGLQKLEDYFIAAKDDNEATSPFPKIPQYPSSLNNLQVATQIFGQSLLRETNQDEYVTGVEFLGLYQEGKELGWVSCGGPNLILSKANGELKIINSESNWSETRNTNTSNLPRNFLGIHPHVHLSMGYTQIEAGDKLLILYTNSFSPLGIKPEKSLGLKEFVELNFKNSKDQNYWIAELKL